MQGLRHLPLIVLALLAGCARPIDPLPAPDRCERLFRHLDFLSDAYPSHKSVGSDGTSIVNPALGRQNQRLITHGCVTFTDDLDGLEAFGASLGFRKPVDSGAPIAPIAIHAGVLTNFTDVTRATIFFRNLGYGTRSIGADGLGRRFYVGPFRSEGALAEAIGIAREAGFIAPYATDSFRFWPYGSIGGSSQAQERAGQITASPR